MSFITDLDVSINIKDEQDLRERGFTKIDVNLNSGAGGNMIYLWYKKGDETSAVTRVQVSFNEKMGQGLERAGYTKIERNLNAGTTGSEIFMWFSKTKGGDYDVPVVDVNVTTSPESEAKLLTTGGVWEGVTCDLNLGAEGDYVYAWLKRNQATYICDVTATIGYEYDVQWFSTGYTRVDVNTNMGATGGAEPFVWYQKTIDATKSLSNLNISTNPAEEKQAEDDGFEKVKVNLNENTGGSSVYLWYKKETGAKIIHAMGILTNMKAADVYLRSDIKVIKRNLNNGNRGATMNLYYV